MNNVVVGDETLISTARASELSGYSKDYVGQLCREDKIVCRRVSGHWYVNEESLNKHQKGTAEASEKNDTKARKAANTETHGIKVGNVRDDTFMYDGVEYIATARATELTGYAQDYIGQLARNGEVEARKVGRRWFVGKDSLLAHKKEKDGLLAAVQAEASGVGRGAETKKESIEHIEVEAQGESVEIDIHTDVEPGDINFNVRYIPETEQALVPKIPRRERGSEQDASGDIQQGITIKKEPELKNIERTEEKVSVGDAAETENTAPNDSRQDEDMLVAIGKEVDFKPQLEKKGKFAFATPVFIALIVIILGSSALFVFFAPHIPSEVLLSSDFLQNLSDLYGDVLPGNNVTYSVE